MRILFVAMPFSIHTLRWINQLENSGHEIHLFSSSDGAAIHSGFKKIKFHEYFHKVEITNSEVNYLPIWSFEFNVKNKFLKKLIGKLYRLTGMELSRADTLTRIVKNIKPDIIHSLETQNAGYIVSKVKNKITTSNFPLWMHSTWGIDLHFYKNYTSHLVQIKECLQKIDLLIVEGNRDEILSRQLGFAGKIIKMPSVGGGFEIPNKQNDDIENRKLILVKGWQDDVRNAKASLLALRNCQNILFGYQILVYNVNQPTIELIALLKKETTLNIQIISESSHEQMLEMNKKSRISLCTNFSDGMPNSMLEAMMLGAFPIQSNTSMANEFINHGVNGFLVDPNDIAFISNCIKEAIENDNLMRQARNINYDLIKTRLDYNKVQAEINSMYNSILI